MLSLEKLRGGNMTSEEIVEHIKSKMFDILNENVFTHDTTIKWFEDLKTILSDFFDIQHATYYIFDTDTFLQLQWNHSWMKKMKAIKWADIKTYYNDQNIVSISFIEKSLNPESEVTILLRDADRGPLGLLTIESTDKWIEFSQSPEVETFISLLSKIVITIKNTIFLTQQEKQYRNLFNITKMFNSTLDIGQILEGTLTAIKDAFPRFHSTLILSNDQDRKTSAPYKLLDYTSERPTTVEAYVSGEITTELMEDQSSRILNVPIKGKQGIYGIIQLTTPIDYLFSARQKEFASLLAGATGNALENAKLYIQSHRLVTDLQLINETSHKLNTNLSINNMLLFLRKQLIKSFHPEQICFVFIEEEEYRISSESTEFFHTLEGQVYIQHVANHFKTRKDSLFIADINKVTETPLVYCSLIGIPFKEQNDIYGFSVVLHKEPYFFSFDSYKLMQSLIQHSSLAISNSSLRHKLQEMVNRDHLTNLYARKYLDKYVETSIENDDRGVFILMDIDNFKQVNDTHGHQVGDEILKQISSIIQKRIDGIGIGARWGGEELALYFSQMTMEQGVKETQKIIELIPEFTRPSVTVSVGVSMWNKKEKVSFHQLFHHADLALYQAKNNGKNQFKVYEASLLEKR